MRPPVDGRPAPRGPIFAVGETIAQRYQVLQFLAEGGMGEVYEVQDLELGERVALKTLHRLLGCDPRALARFRREIQLARRVSHRNVCRIFDVGFAERDGDSDVPPSVGIPFLTLELLEGETLAARIWHHGRLPIVQAFPLVRQMAEALDAAHRAGVLHRDFKSGNVMLVPAADGSLRAVVTDFGMAEAMRPAKGSGTSQEARDILGTPGYLAPEQLSGGPATPATDLYAFGIVLYEMLTGTWPFATDSSASEAFRHVDRHIPPLRTRAPEVDARWEQAILRCLAPDPAVRFSRASELLAALAADPTLRLRRPRRRPLRGLVPALALLLAAGGAARLALPHLSAAPVAAAARPSVAVLGLRQLGGPEDATWLATGLREMLSAELAAGERVRTIPGETLAGAGLGESPGPGPLRPDALSRLRAQIGADYVVQGSYSLRSRGADRELRLALALYDTRTGASVSALEERGAESDLFEICAHAGIRLRAPLGARRPSALEVGAARSALPTTAKAARLYAEGLARLRQGDALGARDALGRAAEIDPGHALTHAALAAAWSRLGYDGHARNEAQRAFELSASLPREGRLFVDALYREQGGEIDRAIALYDALWTTFQDDPEYGIRLTELLAQAGRGKEALATIAALRALPPPAGDDPRIDLAQAAAARAASDYPAQLAAAGSALRKAESRGAPLEIAAAHMMAAGARFRLGDLEPALVDTQKGREIFAAARDRGGEGRALSSVAMLLRDLKRPGEARGALEEALAIAREIGDRRAALQAWNALAQAARDEGRLEDAMGALEQALALARELGNQSGIALTLGNLASLAVHEADLGAARALFEEALSIHQKLGERLLVARTRVTLAELALDEGHPAESEAALRKLLDSDDDVDYQPPAQVVLARALLQQGRVREARAAAQRAEALLKNAGSRDVRLGVAVLLARIRAASGQRTEARRALEAALDEATRAGFRDHQLESRLALCELELGHGPRAAARAHLRELMRDARAVGYELVARRAAVLERKARAG